jgi:hypothetical protein
MKNKEDYHNSINVTDAVKYLSESELQILRVLHNKINSGIIQDRQNSTKNAEKVEKQQTKSQPNAQPKVTQDQIEQMSFDELFGMFFGGKKPKKQADEQVENKAQAQNTNQLLVDYILKKDNITHQELKFLIENGVSKEELVNIFERQLMKQNPFLLHFTL